MALSWFMPVKARTASAKHPAPARTCRPFHGSASHQNASAMFDGRNILKRVPW
jgi:hypothetical protein